MYPELPNIISLIAEHFEGTPLSHFLLRWEDVIFSSLLIVVLIGVVVLASRKKGAVTSRLACPAGRLSTAVELYVEFADDFVCGILGSKGRQFTPFIGTLFLYILCMNMMGLVPFLKSPTANWSTTMALALCVFFYVQYTAFKELGVKGYADHLLGKPRGAIALSVILPLFMFGLHVMGELIKPITLSLRLRSNIWGDDLLLAIFAGFGLKGLPFLFFNTLLTILAGIIQALVFCLLSTIYFALVLTHEE